MSDSSNPTSTSSSAPSYGDNWLTAVASAAGTLWGREYVAGFEHGLQGTRNAIEAFISSLL